MTYEEHLQELYLQFAKSGNDLAAVQKKIEATEGFGEIDEVPEYIVVYNNWQQAGKSYHELEAYLRTQAPQLRTQTMP